MVSQQWSPKDYAKNASFVTSLGEPVIKLLAPQTGERILDLGCGDGVHMEQLITLGCEVVGIDSSPDFVGSACAKGLEAYLMDGQQLNFHNAFDAVFSNAALHWMKDHDKVISSVTKALKPNGRFVGELGARGNIAKIVDAIDRVLATKGINTADLNPWHFPDEDEYRNRLQAHGYLINHLICYKRPTIVDGILPWLNIFAGSFVVEFPEHQQQEIFKSITKLLQNDLCNQQGKWELDYVRLQFSAQKINIE